MTSLMMELISRQTVCCVLRQHTRPYPWTHGMHVMHHSTLPVISVPKMMQQKQANKKKAEEKARHAKHLQQIREDSRKGKREVCIVRCKNHQLNHYQGQSYDRTKGVRLASCGWRHSRAKGDHFTICSREGSGLSMWPTSDSETQPLTFSDLQLHPDIVANLRLQGVVTPTEIQRRAIPRLLDGCGALLAAETGCGKTLAFLAPLLDRLYRQQLQEPAAAEPVRNRPRALVITPGRELAQQIKEVADGLARELPLRAQLLLGGRTKRKMLHPTLLEMDLLVASFGALSKLTSVGVLDLSRVTQVVLDEADTLLDDSFREDVRRLLHRLPLRVGSAKAAPDAPPDASLTLVGATLPSGVDRLLDGLVTGDSLTRITTPRLHRLLPHVAQTLVRLGPTERPEALLRLCRQARDHHQTVIVFSNNAHTCNWVSLYLNEQGIDCLNINGEMHYKLRQGRWHAFLSGQPAVLSCTDIVSRGLDSAHVHHVVNFDFPWNTSDYVHRAGRVGRVGGIADGSVTSFVSRPLEVEMAQRIEMAARTDQELWNVDANIKHIIERRMLRKAANAESRRRS
ncbi:probable ATP-dependent RNA helicase DDX28 [Pollicipes pollicipes]|uniref:probable ATP-dependent RNA helicase DDX28 n=1 Tax=Pollicipes pollicipes TaxID=41117 RepID=UPI00188505CC|nr:probable ATP-dependent RNA helicase DDX28 [Pollicipes pollicipes]